jgi:tetratricopeptide (TPR) repeat protein
MSEDAPTIPQADGAKAAADLESGSMSFQAKGNDFFKVGKYTDAIDMYTRAIEQEPSATVYCNRAFCHIKLENFGSAIMDADETLKIDPRCVRASERVRVRGGHAVRSPFPSRVSAGACPSERAGDPASPANPQIVLHSSARAPHHTTPLLH